jgi:hypothetical protein
MARDPDDYSAILHVYGLVDMEVSTFRLADTLVADGTPAQASLVRQAYFQLLEELKIIAADTAHEAREEILDAENASRVRDDTYGTGGERLEDWIGESHPLTQVEGAVGINYEPDLYAHVPWWWTNEEGYSGHVGRELHGYYYDAGWVGATRPGETTGQALFGPTGPKGPPMTIQNPIPERRFVQRGAEIAEQRWHRQIDSARRRFFVKVDAAVAAAAAVPEAEKRRNRRGGGGPGRRRP